jgi:hypothetical protein
MKYLKAVVAWLLTVILLFASFTIYTANFDLRDWSVDTRFLMGFLFALTPLVPAVVIVLSPDDDN